MNAVCSPGRILRQLLLPELARSTAPKNAAPRAESGSEPVTIQRMYAFLKFIHIAAVATWFGANMVQAFVSRSAVTSSREVRLWWSDNLLAMARILYNVAGIVVLFTGIGLVIDTDISMGSTFVSIGFLAVVVGAVLGMAVFAPGLRKYSAAVKEGNESEAKAIWDRLGMFGILDSAILLLAIFAMVDKWGVKF